MKAPERGCPCPAGSRARQGDGVQAEKPLPRGAEPWFWKLWALVLEAVGLLERPLCCQSAGCSTGEAQGETGTSWGGLWRAWGGGRGP